MKKITPLAFVLIILVVSTACQFSYDLRQVGVNPTPQTQSGSTNTPPPPGAGAGVIATPGPAVLLDPRSMENVLVALFARVNPGVVAIQILTANGGGLGSGFVYNTDGYIITNYHVVQDADSLEVDFPSGFKAHGKVVATDLDSDLAVIKVDAPASELKPLPLGDSDTINVGQTVVAIGNPFGLSSSMTLGIISAKGRTLDSIRETPNGDPYSAGDLIQTDAAINPGNSGGPLLNLNGEVIGLNRAIRTTQATVTGEPVNSGIGFAVSINIIKRVVPILIEKGKYDYPYIGVTSRESLSLADQEALGLKTSVGAYLITVVKGGPADQAGLVGGSTQTSIPGLMGGGDLITRVDDVPVRVFGDFLAYLMTKKSPGDKVVVSILRNGEPKQFNITLEKRP